MQGIPSLARIINKRYMYESKEANVMSRVCVISIYVPEIQKAIDFYKIVKVDFIVAEPTECPPGKFISFRDSFGNVLEYLQFDHV